MQYTISNSKKGDEEIQATIFNTVMREIDPNIPLMTPAEIKIRNPIYGSLRDGYEYNAENLKFLVHVEKGVVGYAESAARLGSYHLHYPLILKEHRFEDTLHLLFVAHYELAKSKKAKRIRAIYNKTYDEIHSFLRNQQVVPIKEIQETARLAISVEELDYPLSGYEFIPFTQEKIRELVEFRYSTKKIAGRDVSEVELQAGFESGKYSPENSTLIYHNGQLQAWWCVKINFPPHDYNKQLNHSIGVPNELIINLGVENLTDLRKAQFKAGYEYLRKKGVKEFRVWTPVTSAFYQEYDQYGFHLTGEGEYVYLFE